MNRVIMDREQWPTVFELDVGQSRLVRRKVNGTPAARTVVLKGVEHRWQPDYWCRANPERRILEEARVSVEVDGEPCTLRVRPYQFPVPVNGLRLYVETTRTWAREAGYARMEDVERTVRFSAVAEGESWGPANLVFPVPSYRWRSSTYNNTWLQIVPYNNLYYHRGEDYGAIPDRLDVVAPWSGHVAQSPVPGGDGRSNAVTVRHASGIEARFGHMNSEHIPSFLTTGSPVAAGDLLGRTGSTWDGRKAQYHDPHLHVGFHWQAARISPYPFMVEAYFRDMPDALIPNAGGFAFTTPGRPVTLDATRSLARPGRRIVSHVWELHDGRTSAGPVAEIVYDRPGLYSETLVVRADDGVEDRDYLQVRVFDPRRGRDMARGWIYMAPGRGLEPGRPALFWNRLTAVQDAVIDFGDGSKPRPFPSQTSHVYREPGLYTVTASGSGPEGEPAAVRLRVIVSEQ